MQEIILSTKLRNAIKRANRKGFSLKFDLRNININGRKQGCSGFVSNLDNGSVVYVNTEPGYLKKYLYRYADSTKDYRGYLNRFATTLDELADDIVSLLKTTLAEVRDIK